MQFKLYRPTVGLSIEIDYPLLYLIIYFSHFVSSFLLPPVQQKKLVDKLLVY